MRVDKICASEGKHVFRQVESSSYLKIQDPGEKHLVHPLTIQSSQVADKAGNPAALWEIACVRRYIFNISNY